MARHGRLPSRLAIEGRNSTAAKMCGGEGGRLLGDNAICEAEARDTPSRAASRLCWTPSCTIPTDALEPTHWRSALVCNCWAAVVKHHWPSLAAAIHALLSSSHANLMAQELRFDCKKKEKDRQGAGESPPCPRKRLVPYHRGVAAGASARVDSLADRSFPQAHSKQMPSCRVYGPIAWRIRRKLCFFLLSGAYLHSAKMHLSSRTPPLLSGKHQGWTAAMRTPVTSSSGDENWATVAGQLRRHQPQYMTYDSAPGFSCSPNGSPLPSPTGTRRGKTTPFEGKLCARRMQRPSLFAGPVYIGFVPGLSGGASPARYEEWWAHP
jgi:hypothetical protein